MNKRDESLLSYRIKETFNEDSLPPHVLVELSQNEHRRLKDNIIQLNGLEVCISNGDLVYSSVTYGTNLKMNKSSIQSEDKTIPSYKINLQSTKKSLLLITASKKDILLLHPELLTSCSTYNADPSGVVVLMACVARPIKKNNKVWSDDDFKRVKKCKPNILQGSNHHESSGYYASFGNKGSFEKVKDSSVGQYTTKKKDTLQKQIILNMEATLYETLCANEISRSVNDLQKFLPNIKRIIAPVLETSFNLQITEAKDLNLREMSSYKDGCWQTCICMDAQTKHKHTEHDCTYTLISIPQQNIQKTSIKYDFIFHLTKKHSINIPLKPGVSFIFSGFCLSHRQNKSRTSNKSDETFFNIASYGNKRLFYHLRKTYNKK